ncbi:hypothetical protein F4556_007560 [Kitasatospora gansuensis]|uniref:Uncharacterized protein n=1 Tax=Kitasatospora gansuensis TaxID=258050 RepID=A0A7W7SK11_9ACTN|nr:hypothetical protein [Kitasatospora gansuensis]MBB4951906.1 hypothetical protein [Kitasatospora gansuensis]
MGEILINTTTASIQRQPAVAGFLNSHYLVVWEDAGAFDIKGQLFQADGTRFRDEFVVNGPGSDPGNTDRGFPAATGTGSGPVVVWLERAINPPGPQPRVKMQRFDLEGRKAGPEIQVSTSDADPERRPSVTSTIDGGCLVAWADARSDQRIRAQRFGPDGAKKGSEFTVNVTEGFHHSPITTRISGDFVVAWRSDPSAPGGGALTFRILDFEGSPKTGETVPGLSGFRGDRAMTVLDDGRFVIAHVRGFGPTDLGVDASLVEASVFKADGTRSAVFSATSADGINSAAPALAPLPNGRFLLSWVQKSAETFSTVPTVRAKVFAADVGSVGPEIEVDNGSAEDRFHLTAGSVFDPAEGEKAFLVWADRGGADGDSSDTAVRGRILDVTPPGGLA